MSWTIAGQEITPGYIERLKSLIEIKEATASEAKKAYEKAQGELRSVASTLHEAIVANVLNEFERREKTWCTACGDIVDPAECMLMIQISSFWTSDEREPGFLHRCCKKCQPGGLYQNFLPAIPHSHRESRFYIQKTVMGEERIKKFDFSRKELNGLDELDLLRSQGQKTFFRAIEEWGLPYETATN
jgi:hypothetical protein